MNRLEKYHRRQIFILRLQLKQSTICGGSLTAAHKCRPNSRSVDLLSGPRSDQWRAYDIGAPCGRNCRVNSLPTELLHAETSNAGSCGAGPIRHAYLAVSYIDALDNESQLRNLTSRQAVRADFHLQPDTRGDTQATAKLPISREITV